MAGVGLSLVKASAGFCCAESFGGDGGMKRRTAVDLNGVGPFGAIRLLKVGTLPLGPRRVKSPRGVENPEGTRGPERAGIPEG